jgi:methylmalonyl-CoA/ethylmalonyl-CoA epimerase
MIEAVDHVAIAVPDIDDALRYYAGDLALPLLLREEQPEVGVRVAYLQTANVRLQLVEPTAAGPVREFVAEGGGGLHHVCFAVRDLAAALRRLAPGSAPAVRAGSDGRGVAFLPPQPTGLRVELVGPVSSPAGRAGAAR